MIGKLLWTVVDALVVEACEAVARRQTARELWSTIKKQGVESMHRFYFVEESKEDRKVSAFLHKIVGDDEFDMLHNHPWEWCISIVLSSSYKEVKYKWLPDRLTENDNSIKTVKTWDKREKTFGPLSINYISWNDAHHIELENQNIPVWTLFFHGPRVSTWGFIQMSTNLFREVKKRTKDNKKTCCGATESCSSCREVPLNTNCVYCPWTGTERELHVCGAWPFSPLAGACEKPPTWWLEQHGYCTACGFNHKEEGCLTRV